MRVHIHVLLEKPCMCTLILDVLSHYIYKNHTYDVSQTIQYILFFLPQNLQLHCELKLDMAGVV